MSDVVIRAEGLGKRYVIGHQAERGQYTTLRETLGRNLKSFGRYALDSVKGRPNAVSDTVEDFWALRDVAFEIRRGDVVGIIGRNGAGKSTLLKVLSRITEPTEGRVEITGRVASLLEVGTGFHPELTGRENIYLNGAILGMTHAEIRRKFDEIVAFAEVERFLDTPVKRYSSGMYVRLAFAVAAHLEPEILIVDEVLAVGDTEFQKKCMGKMQDVAGQGRTVLFVSHNTAAVSALCNRGILMAGGRVSIQGSVADVFERYAATSQAQYEVTFKSDPKRPSITGISVDRDALRSNNLIVSISFESPWELPMPIGGVLLRTPNGEAQWGSNGRVHPRVDLADGVKRGVLRCEALNLPLAPGQYLLSVWLTDWYADFDTKPDHLRVVLGEGRTPSPYLPPSTNGHLDWAAVWRTSSRDAPETSDREHSRSMT